MKFVLFILLSSASIQAPAEVYNGTISIGCTNGSCEFSGKCDDLAVPGVQAEASQEYSEINGEIRLKPSSCRADCTGCVDIIGSESDNHNCIGSAGYVYCPELDDCVRPWIENCPFEGETFSGPVEIFCTYGRCNNLSKECAIEIGSVVVGGPYLTGMNGAYTLPEGCNATCERCTCDGCDLLDEGSSAILGAPAHLSVFFGMTLVAAILFH